MPSRRYGMFGSLSEKTSRKVPPHLVLLERFYQKNVVVY